MEIKNNPIEKTVAACSNFVIEAIDVPIFNNSNLFIGYQLLLECNIDSTDLSLISIVLVMPEGAVFQGASKGPDESQNSKTPNEDAENQKIEKMRADIFKSRVRQKRGS